MLILEDGSTFRGWMPVPGTRFGEVVFNTSMTGYQEILTDPSYCGQIVVMTVPHVGNYGIEAEVAESDRAWVEGFVAAQFTPKASSHASEQELVDYLAAGEIPALEDLDTRAVVRKLRQQGAMRGALTSEIGHVDQIVEQVRSQPPMEGQALVPRVTTHEAYGLAAEGGQRFHIAVYDFGVKRNILRMLCSRGARLTVVPAETPAQQVVALGVDGVVLSNGPGDPAALEAVIDVVRDLIAAELPIFGICLGHQLLGLALGGTTFKLPFGHHGGNQPVKDLDTGQVLITSQNHGFAVDIDSLPRGCRVNQVNLNDETAEGFVVDGKPVFSTQYHPEAAPGPHDADRLFDDFLRGVAARTPTAS